MEKIKEFLESEKAKMGLKRRVERCRSCGYKYVRYRSKIHSWICHSCGYHWGINEEIKFQELEEEAILKNRDLRYYLPLKINDLEYWIFKKND